MANAAVTGQAPWWVEQRALWGGDIFRRMALAPDSREERRIQALRRDILERDQGGRRRVSMRKAQIITRAYRESESLHPAIRRALAMERVFQEIPVALAPGQLLMGTASSGPHIVDVSPELLHTAQRQPDPAHEMDSPLSGVEVRFILPDEERRIFEEDVWPYWQQRARGVIYARELQRHYPEAWRFAMDGGCFDPVQGGPLHHTVQDYASFLRQGVDGVVAEITEQIARLDPAGGMTSADYERRDQYEAMLIAARGLVTYAERNAALADELAGQESDPARRAELLEMARICRKVPRLPADSWWEALQSFHFLRLATALSEDDDSNSAGRFDQYMLPYVQADIAAGRLRRAQAQELLECLFLKWNETCNFRFNEPGLGRSNNDKITIGGTDCYGRDASNDLSYMLLEAHAHVHLNDPNLSVRLHRNTPDEFLRCSLEVVRLGGGLPILISDEAIVPALSATCGVALEHARDFADLGCQENVTDPNMSGADSNGRCNAGWFSLPKPIELALGNGVNPMNGRQVGPQTGDARSFSSMDDFVAAVRAQVEHAVRLNVVCNNVNDYVFARYYPSVFHNLMHPGPRRTGIDINAGGCRYNWTGTMGVGLANAGDMLAAIDTVVFRERQATWDELLAALARDWQGAESLRRACLAAPKYGSDNEYADDWAGRYLGLWLDAYESHRTPRGGRFVGGLISMGSYVTLGRWLGATPDGRQRGERLADATSPSHYAPAAGPTAAHRSAARAIDGLRMPNGVTFNQRFNATAIAGARDLSKWADLVRAYVEAGGVQVQYSIMDREMLLAAQRHPERYRDLIVRVGGYSAVFVELNKDLQESILARTEQGL